MQPRKASARWQGGLKDSKGSINSASGVLNGTKYSFSTRFEDQPGTNPEELIAAAHAACFSMALSAQLGNRGLTPEQIDTDATVTLKMLPDGGPTITDIHLTVRARIPNADPAKFDEAAQAAKEGCPVSKVLKAANITMDAKLENSLAA